MRYKYINRPILSASLFWMFFLLLGNIARGQSTFTTSPSDTDIVTALTGAGIGISNPSLENGQRNLQIATFSNGISGASFGIDAGVLFSTGNAGQDLNNRNSTNARSNNPANTGTDPQLLAIDPTAAYNTVAYSFDITLDANVSGIRISFQFGSEEYPDYVGSRFNDVFGFFVSGPGIGDGATFQNFALLPSNNSVIAVNSVNGGVFGASADNPPTPTNLDQTQFYINNGHLNTGAANPQPQPGPFPVHIEYNGITTAITKDIGGLVPGGVYRFKVAIADVGDGSYDSGVLLNQIIGLQETDLALTKEVDNPTPAFGGVVTFTLTASNNGPNANDVSEVTVDDLLPSGYTYVTASASQGAYDPLTGVWDIGDMDIGAVETLEIQVIVNDTGDYLNTASIQAGNAVDPNQTNNFAEASTVPVAGVPPVANNDEATTDLDTPVTFNITDNDTDSDGNIVPSTVDLDPSTPGQQTSMIVPGVGTYTVDASGNVTFTPELGFLGISVITYTVNDNDGLTSNLADIIVQVGHVCAEDVDGEEFSLSDGQDVTFNQPATDYGFQFDIYTLDNSFNLNVNGIDLATEELEFQSSGTSGINVRFADGDQYEANTLPIWQMTGDATAPLIRVVISPSGNISMYGSKTDGGELFPLELFNGNTFNTINWNSAAPNTIIGSQSVVGTTYMTGYGSGKNITPCNPELTLFKTGVYSDANGSGLADVGDEIEYSFNVENTGNVILENLVIDDAQLSITGLEVIPGVLEPGESGTVTYIYSLTQADIDAGGVWNIAIVSGEDPSGIVVTGESEDPSPLDPNDPDHPGVDPDCPDCTITPLPQEPSFTILKELVSINGDAGLTSYNAVGDVLEYTITVTNTGNVTLENIDVEDALTGLNETIAILAPAGTETFPTTHTITQSDLDNGSVLNVATANGEDPNGDPVDPEDPTDGEEETPATQEPSFTILKELVSVNGDASITSYNAVGDVLEYAITVTNAGNVTLSNIDVEDALTGLSETIATLAPSGTEVFTTSHTITQSDLDNGSVLNVATANGEDPNGNPVDPEDPTDGEEETPATQEPSFTITKSLTSINADAGLTSYNAVGDVLEYTITVTNTGNVTLSNIEVEDALTGLTETITTLAPSGIETFTTSHTVTQSDLDNGSVLNVATANGEDPNGDPVDPEDPTDGEEETPATQEPSFTILKELVSVNGDASITSYNAVGDVLEYAITVTNTGNVTLENIEVE
ncbi:choice-of-anchor L domain-containing protein, partial [Belliella marina]